MSDHVMGATEPKAVEVDHPQVWLRRNIEKDTVEDAHGEEVRAYDVWAWDEVSFVDPTVTEDEARERFDALWAEHEDDGLSEYERLRKRLDEQDEALAELGDLMAGTEA